MHPDEHDDDLSATVEERGDAHTDDVPNLEERFENNGGEAEPDDEDIAGK